MLSPLGNALEREPDARAVFHRVLLPHLQVQGASSTAEIKRRGISLFGLALNDDEVVDVLELARRNGLVEPFDQSSDAYDNRISAVEWSPTHRGEKLGPPTGMSVKDLRDYLIAVLPIGSKAIHSILALAGALLVVPFFGSLFGQKPLTSSASPDARAYMMAAGLLIALMIVLVIHRGLEGDRQLRCAARSWQRLKATWPGFWRWRVNPLRPWAALTAIGIYLAGLALRLAAHPPNVLTTVMFVLSGVIWAVVWTLRSASLPNSSPAAVPNPASGD
ncbi:MAG TPA: hypothetical protein VNS60_11245 [Solirubrobacterales bacterium]|nr:hypothetical protein [Solirubrobacterales bacterium]